MIRNSSIKAQRIDSPPIETVKASDSPDVIEKYLTDEAGAIRGKAEKVFFPVNESEVSAILKWATRTGTPVSVSGGGTGITGSRVPLEGVVLSTEKMVFPGEIDELKDKLVSFRSLTGEIKLYVDEENCLVVTPPGIILSDLYSVISGKNLHYPPNPTELSAAIGGNIATNASGGRSFRNDAIRKWIRGLRVILPTGELIKIKRGEVFADENGEFHIEYPDGKVLDLPIPGYKMPYVKNASGYYSCPGMDLIDLFIGPEGTLGIITQVEMELIKWDGEVFGCIVFFESGKGSVEFVKEARTLSRDENETLDALTLDYFDGNSLEFMREANPDIPADAKAAVYIEQFLPEDPDEVLMAWMELMEKHECVEDWTAMTDRDRERLRKFRHSLPEAVNELVRGRGVRKMGMDLAVPDERLEEIIEIYQNAARENGFDYVLFGHIGNNNLHMNFLPRDAGELERIKKAYMETARKGIAMGGTISAEHGVGKKTLKVDGETQPYLYLMYGKEGLESIAGIKLLLDPAAILNRGNIISAQYLKQKMEV